MRKVFYTLIAILFCFNTIAQEKHLTFKGIPIDGNIHTFANKLKQQGYKELLIDGRIFALTGDFSYLSNCNIYLFPNPSNLNIYKVGVVSTEYSNWTDIYNHFNKLVSALKDKYGFNYIFEEIFINDDQFELNDISKWNKLINGEAKFRYEFSTENGSIKIYLNNHGRISIIYFDNINNHANEIRKKNDL